MFSTVAKNAMLNALSLANASLHSGFPGQTGASEISGGAPAYARKAITVGSASGEARTLTAGVTFDVGAGTTVRWLGFWDSGSTVFQAYAPNGGTPREFVVDPSTDTFRSPAHGYANTQKIVFYNGTMPGGLTEGTIYFVVSAATDTFQVSATSGGAAIDITSAGSSGVLLSNITEDTYAAQGSHTLSAGTFALQF
jgi:hypothetical protein